MEKEEYTEEHVEGKRKRGKGDWERGEWGRRDTGKERKSVRGMEMREYDGRKEEVMWKRRWGRMSGRAIKRRVSGWRQRSGRGQRVCDEERDGLEGTENGSEMEKREG